MLAQHPSVLLDSLLLISRSALQSDDPLVGARALLQQIAGPLGARGARLLLADPRGRLYVALREGIDFAPCSEDHTTAAQSPDPSVWVQPVRLAGTELAVVEVWAPDGSSAVGDEHGASLALLCAQIAPALAVGAESATRAREAARVRSLLDAAQTSVSSLALKDVLRRAMQAVRDLFGASGVAIWRLDEAGTLRRFGSLGIREEYVRALTSMSPTEGVLGIALREGRPVAIQDLSTDPRVKMRAHLEREGIRSLLSVPLLSRGRALGALTVYYRSPRAFSAADQESLAGLVNHVAAAIDNALAHAATRSALAEVSAQRELLDLVVRHAQDGILALDGGGRVVLFSPGCERLTGWTAAAAFGRHLSEVLVCDCPADAACDGRAPQMPRPGLAGYAEVHLMTPSGEERWLGISTARVSSRRASAPRTVAVLRDVTEARQVDEMKTAILSTVSHELRTPLTSIRALSELLEEHEGADSDVRQMAGTINRESERLTRLVANILDVARIQAGRMPCEPCAFPLAPALREAAEVLDGARRSHRLEVRAADDLPAAWADPDRLRQVLDNLYDNATKYSPPDSRVTVLAELMDERPAAAGARRDARTLRVSVLDEGPGIPASQLERIFERFHRVSETAGGSGLGLYLTRGLVELMGGRVWAETAPGGGACFRFTLPISPSGAERATKAGPPVDDPAVQRVRA